MAVTFLEPGGDATFNVATITGGGFWGAKNLNPATATDFVHGSHIKSILYNAGATDRVTTPAASLNDGGTRISVYIYLNALPTTSTATIFNVNTSAAATLYAVKLTTGGIIQLFNNATQIGSNGSTLSTGIWYRLCLAYTVTSTVVNEARVFKNGLIDISVSNASLSTTGSDNMRIGNISTNAGLDLRTSDHYIDNSASLTDTGDIWVTAKRPFANGTTNGFSTQIGAGGSGYGTGHSPQVNERALSTTNGWSMIGAGSAVTEEYNIEGKSIGDFNIFGTQIVDCTGWAYTSSLAGETINIILNGVNFSQAITSTNTMYTKVAGSTIYPSGSGTDIGIQTDTSLTTVSLYECGVMVAFKMPSGIFGNYSPYIHSGAMSRNERAT